MTARAPAPSATSPIPRAVAGVLLALLGSALLTGLFVISYGQSEFCQRMVFRLGLAPSVLISAVAQSLVLVGVWLLWSAIRRS